MSEFSQHEFLRTYLRYVERTESPRLFHVWVALSSISACLGRRCWFDGGIGQIWPNMYVVLVGPPGTRKGHAIKYSKKLLQTHTGVRFAPDDTGGARQGLIAAMTACDEAMNDEDVAGIFSGQDLTGQPVTMASLGKVNGHEGSSVLDKLNAINFDTRDPRTMYATAGELNSFLGEKNTQMLTFLQEMWDGGSYKYQLKNTEYEIKDAVLGIMGATTPTQIALALPAEAVGQGFTSRMMFVYAAKQHARIARPALDEKAGQEIAGIYSAVFNDFNGPFSETKEAAQLHDDIYLRGVLIKDPRFVYYADRRQTHFEKLAMALAAGRGSMTIEVNDYKFADELLLETEAVMPDALGEYGMSKLSSAKQKLMEFITASEAPIPMQALQGIMQRDMTPLEFKTSVSELHNAKKLTVVAIAGLGQCVIGVSTSAAKQAKRDYNELDMLMSSTKKGTG